jgi:hypothetical protein
MARRKFVPVVGESPQRRVAIRGRGASWSPANRFEKLHVDLADPDVVDVYETEEKPRRPTQYFVPSRSTQIGILSSSIPHGAFWRFVSLVGSAKRLDYDAVAR